MPIFPTILGLGSPRHSETISAKKRYTLLPSISDDCGLRSPRHSETISAKKRYTLDTSISDDCGLRKSPPSFKNHFSQKTVYLHTCIVACVGGCLMSFIVLSKAKHYFLRIMKMQTIYWGFDRFFFSNLNL